MDLHKDWIDQIKIYLSKSSFKNYDMLDDDQLTIRVINYFRKTNNKWKFKVNGFDNDFKNNHPKFIVDIEAVLKKIEQGESMESYLSTRAKDLSYKDIMFNAWNIIHYHLKEQPNRTNELLYVKYDFDNKECTVLDLYTHGHFRNTDILLNMGVKFPELIGRKNTDGKLVEILDSARIEKAMDMGVSSQSVFKFEDKDKNDYEYKEYMISTLNKYYNGDANWDINALVNLKYLFSECEKDIKKNLDILFKSTSNHDIHLIFDDEETMLLDNNSGEVIKYEKLGKIVPLDKI